MDAQRWFQVVMAALAQNHALLVVSGSEARVTDANGDVLHFDGPAALHEWFAQLPRYVRIRRNLNVEDLGLSAQACARLGYARDAVIFRKGHTYKRYGGIFDYEDTDLPGVCLWDADEQGWWIVPTGAIDVD